MLTDSEIIQLIDDTMQSIWIKEIKEDYECGWLLKEDTLKNAMYFHLRNRLSNLFEENDIRIFTEFIDGKFQHSGYRPDLVIAKVDMDSEADYWGKAVTECLAVIEIKYKAGFKSHEEIEADYEKLRYYAEELKIAGHIYMATIWECEDDATTWIRKNAAWAKGRVTELNASYERSSDGNMRFYVYTH